MKDVKEQCNEFCHKILVSKHEWSPYCSVTKLPWFLEHFFWKADPVHSANRLRIILVKHMQLLEQVLTKEGTFPNSLQINCRIHRQSAEGVSLRREVSDYSWLDNVLLGYCIITKVESCGMCSVLHWSVFFMQLHNIMIIHPLKTLYLYNYHIIVLSKILRLLNRRKSCYSEFTISHYSLIAPRDFDIKTSLFLRC